MARTRNVEKFDAQRQELLQAAGACFIRLGFHGASIADICAEAGGISPGRLYHYFPSKQAIVEAMVAEERAEMASLFVLSAIHDDPVTGLQKLIERMILLGCGPDYGLLAAEVIGESFRNAEVGRILRYAERDMRERLIAALADARRAAQTAGTPTWAEKDDDRLARGLTLIVDGATVRALLEPAASKTLAREAGDLARLLLSAAAR
jgi:AcrR family transcriptional regulator